MPRPRFDRAAPEMREALLDTAAREFATHGYGGASTNRILLAAGLSKGAFYYYFDDKADLAAAVLARESARWIEQFGALPMPRSPDEFWTEIETLNERGMAELRDSPDRGELMARLGVAAARDPVLMQRLGPFIAQARSALLDFFRCGQRIGAVRSDLEVEAILTILQAIKQAIVAAMLPADAAPTAEQLARFSRIHLDCMRRVIAPTREH